MNNNRLIKTEDLEELKKLLNHPDCSFTLKTGIGLLIKEIERYHRLEDDGKLAILPCKPNEIVWSGSPGFKPHEVLYTCQSHILSDMEDGCVIGYTEEEVKKKLEENKNEK